MILTLGIVLIAAILAAWLVVMYMWYKTERGATLSPIHLERIETELERVARLVRRSWYGTGMYSTKLLKWGEEKAENVFLKVFPSAAPAFTKRDELTGLEHGPSSYFLLSISPLRKRKSPTRKNTI